ncbi:MAG: hypothetical protein ACR2PL_07150 [Dehalococcoidia bacterium]
MTSIQETTAQQTVDLPVERVVRRRSDWPRLDHDEERVAYFRDIFDDLPPIVVEADSYRLIDGWHRVEAAVALGRSEIVALVVPPPVDGVLAASLAYAARAAKPLSRADRRHALGLLLRENPRRSDRWLATIVGVSAATVASVRAELEFREEVQPIAERLGRDGRERPVVARRERVSLDADESREVLPDFGREIDGFDPYDEPEEPPIEETARVERKRSPFPVDSGPVDAVPPQPTIGEQDERAAQRRYVRGLLDQLTLGLEQFGMDELIALLREGVPGYPAERAQRLTAAWHHMLGQALG